MRATGIVRRVDDLGRIIIPKEVRRMNGISEGTPMELFTTNDGIYLKKYIPDVDLAEQVRSLERMLVDNKEYMDCGVYTEAMEHVNALKNILNQRRTTMGSEDE